MKKVAICVVAMALAGCAAGAEGEQAEAPEVSGDELGLLTEGATYEGWTQSTSGYINAFIQSSTISHTFTRSSGVTSRGGGACLVRWWEGSSCSDDSTCTSLAVGTYGGGAYGYCYGGTCMVRPGHGAYFCTQASDRSVANGNMTLNASTVYANPGSYSWHVMGCMTKAAGPSQDCNSTNTALSMRSMGAVTVDGAGGGGGDPPM